MQAALFPWACAESSPRRSCIATGPVYTQDIYDLITENQIKLNSN